MQENYYLAIDQGGQSSRVGVYTGSGQRICDFRAECATQQRQAPGSAYPYIEQRGDEILSGIRDCLAKVEAYLGKAINNIQAAGYAGQGSSLVCWNTRSGETLSPVISWQDIRGEPYLKDISLSLSQAQHITGLRVSPHYGASKIRWCLDNNPAVKRAFDENSLCVGPVASFIFWHLLGRKKVIDPGHAQRTLLWNLHNNAWDERLLELFQIPKPILPECRYHDSCFGELEIANHRIPFSAAARDQGASLFAAGMPDASTCYVNLGTGAFIQRLSDRLHAPAGLLVSPLWVSRHNLAGGVDDVASSPCYLTQVREKNWYAWEGTVNGAASAIPYIQGQTGLEITPAQIETALSIQLRNDVYFLNSLGGLGAPYWRTDLKPLFAPGLGPMEKICAWIESLLFQIAVNVELMKKAGDIRLIRISGGFSKSNKLCQALADVTGLDVYRSDNADATLQGIACMATGLSENWQPLFEMEHFSPRENVALQKRFSEWNLAMEKWLK